MQLSVGIDSVSIARIEKSMGQERFLTRNFTQAERDYFAEKKLRPETVAGHFCAKEAFAKVMGTGFREFELADVAVLHDALGAPSLALTGAAAACAQGAQLAVSITHTETTATAIVTALHL